MQTNKIVKMIALRAILATVTAFSLQGGPAWADVEYFPYTYGWMTPPKGEVELEIKHTQPANNRNWQDSASVEYGVTDRYMIEPYIVYNRSGGFGDPPASTAVGDADDGGGGGGGAGSAVWDPIHNGAAYRYAGFQLEQRYRFGDFAYNKVLTSAYLEYEKYRNAPDTLESKLILEYNTPSQLKVDFNLIAGSPLYRASTQWEYSLGVANLAADKRGRFWYGAEAFGNWSSTQHWAGPSAGVFLNSETRLTGTYGKLIRGSGADQFRLALSHEFH